MHVQITESADTSMNKLKPYFAYAATFLTIGYVVACLGTYGSYPGYLDQGEPIVAAAAFKMLSGSEVYPSFEGTNFTSNVYGPYLYLATAMMMWGLGGSVLAGKLAGLVGVCFGLVVTAYSFQKSGRNGVMAALIATAGFIFLFFPYSFWNRPDPFLFLVVALGVLIIRRPPSQNRLLDWVLLGVLGGVACSLKIYGPLFLFPLGIYVAVRDKSFQSLFVMALVGIATALAPFLLPQFSLPNYLAWFSYVAEKPTDWELVGKALRYAVFFILPPILLISQRFARRANGQTVKHDAEFYYCIATLIGLSACIYLAAKPGAGMYYVFPFVPIVVDFMHRAWRTDDRPEKQNKFYAIVSILLVASVITVSIPIQKRFFRALDWDRTSGIKAELENIKSRFPDQSIQMAMGDSIGGYHNTLQKTELIFGGHPYTVDFGVMIETSKMGIKPSKPLVESFRNCATDIWLVPANERPMEMIGYYGNKVVDETLKAAFYERYSLAVGFKYFDVWHCRRN